MFNITQIREKSHVVLWLFLIVFVLSMVAGGLLGGANIVDLMFGGSDPNRYAGWVDKRGISHREFQNQYNNQLSAFQQQNRTIDGRTVQTASNNAWNIIVENEFKNKKIEELGLSAQETEIYEFLFYTPPVSFQNMFIAAGIFVDVENKFVLEDYQLAVENGDLPEEFNAAFARWETYLKNWLGNRKLQNLYNKSTTISDQEIKFEYLKNNVNCNIDYIFINTNTIPNSEVTISDEDIKKYYDKNKAESYKIPNTRSIEYISWKISNDIRLDTLNYNSYVDSLKNNALVFADEADISSFDDAIKNLNYTVENLEIHEGFNNNSGFPFLMGTSRAAVRFIFDNDIGTISDPIQMDNQIIVIHIIDEKSAGYKPLEDVAKNIKSNLITEKKKEYALDMLNLKLSSNDDWDKIAKQDSLITFLSNQSGTLGGSFKDIGKSSDVTGALLALEKNQISNILTTYNTLCKIKLNSKDDYVQEDYDESYDELKNQLTNAKNNSNYQTWLNHMKDNSKVNDYRSKTY